MELNRWVAAVVVKCNGNMAASMLRQQLAQPLPTGMCRLSGTGKGGTHKHYSRRLWGRQEQVVQLLSGLFALLPTQVGESVLICICQGVSIR